MIIGKYTFNKYVGVIIITYTDIVSEIYSNTGFKIYNSCYFVFTELICPFYDVFPILKAPTHTQWKLKAFLQAKFEAVQ